MGDILQIVTTVPADAATRIARTLVDERLAACVQAEPIRSLYRWQDAVEEADEVRLSIKTVPARREAVVARVAALHPYDLPEIGWSALATTNGYRAWIETETE